MATTDTKAGFRLPWSSDKSDAAPTDAAAGVGATPDAEPVTTPQENETPDMIDAVPAATDPEAAVETEAATDGTVATTPDAATTPAPAATPAPPPVATRKPNKFMADLTKAMQAAAETAREETLARLAADAKAFVEDIHATSASEATELRKKADDDVAAIREWSKAEIARIREETDERISHRKEGLDREIEEHAAAIEARIERVQGRVAAFENEMAAFFERLLAEDDPTRFAAMAESLPEPPALDGRSASTWEPTPVAPVAEIPVAEIPVAEIPVAETPVVEAAPHPRSEAVADPPPAAVAAPAPAEPTVAESAPVVAAEEPSADEPTADGGDLFAMMDEGSTTDADPRLAVLGISPDFAAAEAEAATFDASVDGSDEPVPELADDDIAARLAGLVSTPDGASGETATTRVVVTGLVSVASIAGFKRHLSRAAGVQSVGVSSGPDGEFVFAVGHSADVALRDVIPALPGFGARVTGDAEGELTVAARDPEAEG